MSDSFATPWTVAHQTPLSMRVPSQEYWTGLTFFFSNVHLVAHFNMNSSGGMRYYGDGWNLNFSVYIFIMSFISDPPLWWHWLDEYFGRFKAEKYGDRWSVDIVSNHSFHAIISHVKVNLDKHLLFMTW